ncbi:MAG: hypothetical protein AB7O59_20655 [Pirellulales bacterium]
MNVRKQWYCAVALALCSGLTGIAQGNDASTSEPFNAGPSLVRLAGGTSWNETQPEPAEPPSPFAEEPVAKPESATESVVAGPSTCTTGCASGCTTGCGSCQCVDECCCAPQCSLIASAEATFFWPQFNRGFLTNSVNNGTGQIDYRSDSRLGSVDGGLLVAPRITLGVQGCKWGLVGRYWYSSPWATAYTPPDITLETPGVILFDNFRAYTVDLELQRRFYTGCWTGYGLFGVRYASVDNDRTLNATSLRFVDPDSADILTSSSFASQQFSGAGITFGFWATRPICCDSPLKYFVANRYSFLWGNGSAASQTTASIVTVPDGFAAAANGAGATGQGDLFIAELQLGLQWEAQLKCFPGRAFVRSALEYQYWDSNVGLDTSANSFAAVDSGANASVTASAGDLLFDLIGFNLGVGITY